MFEFLKRQDLAMGVVQVKAADLKARLDKGQKIKFLDVREQWERETANIEGSQWIPLGELQARFSEVDVQEEVVIYCHSGVRSMKALKFLESRGYKNLKNLAGGINAWSLEADPQVPRY